MFSKEDFILNQIILINIKLFNQDLSFKKNESLNILSSLIELFMKLADYMQDNKKFQCAEKFLSEILNFYKANLLPNHPDIGKIMNN